MITFSPVESAEIESLFDQIWKQVKDSGPRYIYLRREAYRVLRRYKPRPNRCVRVFKLRAKAKRKGN